jgi:hypothetical protein
MAWVETTSLSFTARHEASQSDSALAVLDALESHRARLEELFPQVPGNITVVLHDSMLQLALAHPYVPLGRRLAGRAGRRYMSGWFTTGTVHSLSPALLRKVAGGPDSQEALLLTPQRAYTALVVGTSNPDLPPPFRPRSFARYVRYAWLAEGAAQYFSGQLPHLRAAIARRLRGGEPTLPPGIRDAGLLGGPLFDLVAREHGMNACVRLACSRLEADPDSMLESALGAPATDVKHRWRSHLEQLAKPEPAVGLADSLATEAVKH